jgi:hypothetical protein
MIKVVELTDRSPSIRLSLETAIGFSSAALMALSIAGPVHRRHCHRMTLSSPSRPPSTPASGPLRREQIDALLEKLRDPALARQFLMDAGLIDSDGQLTPPYRNRDAR